MDRVGVHGSETQRAVADGLARALVLAEVAAEHGDDAQAADDITGAIDDLEPELDDLRVTARHRSPACRAAEYAVAAAAPLFVLALHYVFAPLQHAAVLPHVIIVALAALTFGWGPSLAAIATSAPAAAHIIFASEVQHNEGAPVLLALHVLTSLLVAYGISRPRFRWPRAPKAAPVAAPQRTPIP